MALLHKVVQLIRGIQRNIYLYCLLMCSVVRGLLVVGFLILIVPTRLYAQGEYNLALSGASPGGLWSLLGAGVNAAVAINHPGSVITYQTSGGGIANIKLVSEGIAELGIVHDVELKVAAEGGLPFGQPVNNLRAIAYLYDWVPMQLVITSSFAEEYEIETLGDLITNQAPVRFGVNTRGNMVQELNRMLLDAYGVTYEQVRGWGGQIVFAASNDMANLMANRRLDMTGNGLFTPNSTILRTGNAVDVTMLSIDTDVVNAVSEASGARPFTVPIGTYDWLDSDVSTIALGAVLVVNKNMSSEVTYDLAKALVEHIARLRSVHGSMNALTPEFMASQDVIPYHAGALNYFREVGLVN